jgi:PRTRC genetic system protein A
LEIEGKGGKIDPIFLINNIFPAYWIGQEGFSLEKIQAAFAYILDATGWKLYKRNGVSTAVISVDSVAGLATLRQEINLTAPRIPLDLIRRVTAWFKAVYTKYRSEAVGYLFYQPQTGEWQFVPPTQTATGASASYEAAPKIEGWQVVGTIHSHGSMSAFHSGTDDADEKNFDGVHITVGRCDSVPEYSCSLVVQGKREVVDPSVLIDGMAPMDAVPSSWLSAVKEPAPRGLDILFQSKADKLYAAYYAGEMSEAKYLAELKKIEEAERAHKAREAVVKPTSSFGGHGLGERYDGGFARQSFEPKTGPKKEKKGDRHVR